MERSREENIGGGRRDSQRLDKAPQKRGSIRGKEGGHPMDSNGAGEKISFRETLRDELSELVEVSNLTQITLREVGWPCAESAW